MPWLDAQGNRHEEQNPPAGWVQATDGSGRWGQKGDLDLNHPVGNQGQNPVDGGLETDNGTPPPGAPLSITANIQGPSEEEELKKQLNNHFQYGGAVGGATDAANRYAKIGADAQNRQGAQIDNGRAHSYGTQAQGNAAAEGRVADLMWKRANGQVPSIAGMRADEDMRRLAAAQTSAQASARGPAALALAQQNAAANTATGQSTISNMAQVNSAQERSDAEKAAYGAYSGMRGQDFQGQALEQQNAQKQAEINAAQTAENDKMQLGMTGAEIDVNKAQLGAQGNQIGIATGAAQAQASRDQAAGFHSDDETWKALGLIGGIGGTGAGIAYSAIAGSGKNNGSGSGTVGQSTPGGGSGTADDYGEQGYSGSMEGYNPDAGMAGASGVPDPVSGHTSPLPNGGRTPATMGATYQPAPAAPTLANTAPASPAPPAPPKPPTLATPFKPEGPPTITSDERVKYGFAEEGNGGNRVDRFMDGIHPLSYHYKNPDQEPRSAPTGGRYLGISAQDLEKVPEVGPQMVSDGPRGKQIESGPTLSAALAGVARLHERVKELEGSSQAQGEGLLAQGPSVGGAQRRAGEDMLASQRAAHAAALAADPSVGGQRPMTPHERALMAQAQGMMAGDRANLDAGPSVRRVSDGTRDNGYNTVLTDGAERAYPAWLKANQAGPDDTGHDYDYRGAFAAGQGRGGANGHFTDQFKKPNHETFSDESQYAADRPEIAGHWEGERYAPKGPAGWLRQEMERPEPMPEPPTLATVMPRRGPHKRFDDGYVQDLGDANENLGPSGAGNQDKPDYNFVKSQSPLDIAAALETNRRAITPGTEAYMRREGMWNDKTDALLRDRRLRDEDTFTSDIRAKDDVQSESFGPEQDINVSNGRFQPPATPRRAAAQIVPRVDAGPQRAENAASQAAYERAAHASTLAVPLGYGGTLGALHGTLAETNIQRARRAAMHPPPPAAEAQPSFLSRAPDAIADTLGRAYPEPTGPVERTVRPTLANLGPMPAADNYATPSPEELARYGASPAEIAAAQRMNGGR